MMINRQELLFEDRKKPLIKFRDMYEAMNNINEWCETATKHIDKQAATSEESKEETGADILSELRQLEFLLNKSEEIKIKGSVGNRNFLKVSEWRVNFWLLLGQTTLSKGFL